jgi:L-rhamnose isomerase
MAPTPKRLQQSYAFAQERYAALGVDTDAAIDQLSRIAISLHCWQGDDVGGFENPGGTLGGGLAATGNYPGKARTADELRADLDQAYALIPGSHRLNLHAMYAETGGARVDRNALRPEHFAAWIDWAKAGKHGVDFNPSCFSHPLAADGFTLAHRDPAIRKFWVEHCIASRKIGAAFGKALGAPTVTNIWVPDGFKDTPVDRTQPRQWLRDSLDTIFAAKVDRKHNLDAVECKLFGLGSESCVIGSHEFYLGYVVANRAKGLLLCLDAGHFHPTEVISDKLSSVLMFVPEVLLHISRGVRWDSDHVVTLTDEVQAMLREVIVSGQLGRVHIGLDFFDASINRIAAWVIGTRNVQRAALIALLEPTAQLRTLEQAGDYTARLALLEELKGLPWGAVWDMFCEQQGAPVGFDFMDDVRDYERRVLSKR